MPWSAPPCACRPQPHTSRDFPGSAQASIAADKKGAAQTYLKLSGDKESVENIVEMLNDPKVEYGSTPKGIGAFADFLHSTGAINAKLGNWKDAFIPELHQTPGN